MTVLNASQIEAYALNAGFTGNSLTTAIAIALAESSGRTDVTHPNSNGTIDYGLWQINSSHKEYNVNSLLQPAYNAMAAYKISAKGTNFTWWSTYTDGAYKQYVNAANTTTSTKNDNTTGRWNPVFLKDMTAWIANPNIQMYGRWNNPPSANEGGVDLASPGGTPIYALADGPLIGAGNFWHSTNLYTPGSGNPGYGVVTQRINVPGYGMNDIYYQHIQIDAAIRTCYANNCGTQKLTKGQQIGTIVAAMGETEIGFNADWGGIWGVNHPNKWVTDPRPLIKALMEVGPPGTSSNSLTSTVTSLFSSGIPSYTSVINQVHQTLINTPGFYGIALALDESEQFPGWIDLTTKQPDITILGQDTGTSAPDINGIVRSVGATITDNFLPTVIRSGLVLLGGFLLFGLLAKVVKDPVMALMGNNNAETS